MEGIKWKSYDGRVLYIHEMTHEHLSSLYHFIHYISASPRENVIEEIKRVINTNYNGIILPYCPPSDVVGEAEKLHDKGLLKYDKENHKFDIIDNGEWVGEIVLKPEQEVDEETGKFKVDRLAEYKKKRQEEILALLALQNQDNIKWTDIINPMDKTENINNEEDE